MAGNVDLPTGFTLDKPSAAALPQGFTLDTAPAPKAAPKTTDIAEQIFDAPADVALTALSGAAATPIAGLVGLGAAALPGQAGQGARAVGATERALTYEPRTAAGKAAQWAMGLPGKLWSPAVKGAGEYTFGKTGSPLAAALAEGATAAAPSALGIKAGRIAPTLSRPLTMEERAAAAARKAGFRLTAEEAHAGPITKTAESIAGEQTLSKVIARGNQPVVNKLVARDIGVKPGTDFTPEFFNDLRMESGVPYEDMRHIGRVKTDETYVKDLDSIASQYKTAARDFPEEARPDILKFVENMKKPFFHGDSGIDMVWQLRKSADTAYRNGDKGMGLALKETAMALEDQMGRHLEATKAFQPPELLQRWRAGRKRLAKINLADEATNPATGDVDPTVYGRALKRKQPLDGDAKRLAEAALAHERSIKSTAKLGATGPSWWDVIIGAGSGHANWLFVRPGIRALLSSRPYQAAFMRPGPGFARQILSQPIVPQAAGVAAGAQQPPEQSPVTATPQPQQQNENVPITSVRG